MGKVVQLDTYRGTEHADALKREAQVPLLAECKSLQSHLSNLREGFEEIRDILTEHNKKRGWPFKG